MIPNEFSPIKRCIRAAVIKQAWRPENSRVFSPFKDISMETFRSEKSLPWKVMFDEQGASEEKKKEQKEYFQSDTNRSWSRPS